MKICLFGVSGVALGKRYIKDPRLDPGVRGQTCLPTGRLDSLTEKE